MPRHTPGQKSPQAKAARSDRRSAALTASPAKTKTWWSKIGWNLILLSVIAVLGATLYGKTLSYPFVFDDQFYLETNPIYKDIHHFLGYSDFQTAATQAQVLKLDPDLATNFVLRQFSYWTFYFDYATHGLDPHGYRLENVMLHCANAWLVFLLSGFLLRCSALARKLAPSSVRFISLVTALLFLVHPLQTESVTYVVQRFTSLATFFYLATLVTYFLARESKRVWATWAWGIISVVALILGMASKEIVVTAPLMIVALECFLMATPWRQALKRAAAYLVFLPVIPVMVLMTSRAQHQGALNLGDAYNIVNPIFTPIAPFSYVLTEIHVLVRYLALLLVPVGLNVDHDYALSTSLWDARVLGALAFIALCVVGAVILLRRYKDTRISVMCLGAGWFLVTALVPAGLVPLPDVMAEHRTYLPSVGMILAVVCALDMWRTRWSARPWVAAVAPAVAVLAVVVCAGATRMRNEAWSSRLALWQDTVTKSPQKARSWYNLGMVQYELGQKEDSVASLQRAVDLDGGFGYAYLSLGAYQADLGRPADAIKTFRRGIAQFPDSAKLYYNLGVMSYRQGQVGDARQAFESAVHWEPENRGSQLWLARVCEESQEHQAAIDHLKVADALQPGDIQIQAAIQEIQQRLRPANSGTAALISTR